MLLTLETAGLVQVSLRLLTIGALALACIVSYNYARVLLLRRRLPPGPFPLPVIGNHFRIPYWQPWVKFEEWSRQYANPMITIWLGSRPVIVLNDAWTASDLLEKRADVYSSRPRFVAMGELTGSATTNQATLVYGDQWRVHRKLTVSTNPRPGCIDTGCVPSDFGRSTPSLAAMWCETTGPSRATSLRF